MVISSRPFLDTYLAALGSSKLVAYLSLFFAAIGFVNYVSFGLKSINLLLQLFVLSGKNLKKYGAGNGAWALITGASDGIGKEFSLQLAKKGFNVVLVSRTESKLVDLALEIKEKYGVETKILPFNFAESKSSDYTALAALIEPLDITVLINNVGQSHSIPVPFAEVDDAELTNIVTINNLATLKVTKLVVPKLIAKKKGLILTMGSFGGLLPTPYLSVYSGSKAFLQHWSTALAAELKPKGIDVELVLSYLVTSAMSKIRKTSALIPNPKMFVASTLSSIGLQRGAQGLAATSTPYWSHAIFQFFIENTVGIWSSIVSNQNLQMHITIRKRALKKAEREKKGL
ncbi:hypothetical protein POJ06DRAFT_258991 [Lipomyces tetrasporus]|uniref:Very-long-chain 3-oxoacyl-CoA reductase n=1 Tax=Lipomyces tetrasporus TaxID=54092 RepID=A0AAD7QR61_9ASCO|nr:uncharacterized protein POJ06DRAFT_258991 [Lipomyces tetrasporus]KAJ8098267.1 hypothetical protein POJ06DRAFT_258991 [Lipomyces tetrasporus]